VTLPVGPLTPYVTPETLRTAPTGIAWGTIPPWRDATQEQRAAEMANICARATAQADEYVNGPLRATLDTEVYHGPDFRVTWQRATGNTRIVLQRWPVLSVVQVETCPASVWPRTWTPLPAGWAEPEYLPAGVYGSAAPSGAGGGGQSVIIGPGAADWSLGRQGWAIRVTYVNGWPHAGLTAGAAAGDTSLQVDDCTGWAVTSGAGVTGATGVVKDSGAQEVVQVTAASAQAGPGTLTLAAPLRFPHQPGVAVTTLPASAEWAVILFATAQALTRGATTTTVQALKPATQTSVKHVDDLCTEAELLLSPYRRVI